MTHPKVPVPSVTRQRRFTLTLDPSLPISANKRRIEQAVLNDPQPLDPSRGLGRYLKEEARECIRELSTCEAAHLPGFLRAARMLRRVIQTALADKLVSEIEAGRTERQLAHPLTVADFIAALDQTIRDHRAPACFEAGHDLNEVKALIAGHFAVTQRQLAALCSVAGVVTDQVEGGAL